jgi:hypothetical protein
MVEESAKFVGEPWSSRLRLKLLRVDGVSEKFEQQGNSKAICVNKKLKM